MPLYIIQNGDKYVAMRNVIYHYAAPTYTTNITEATLFSDVEQVLDVADSLSDTVMIKSVSINEVQAVDDLIVEAKRKRALAKLTTKDKELLGLS